MKAYTDIEQSKKLANILPLESADMCWTNHCYGSIRSSMTVSSKTIEEYKELLTRFGDLTNIDVFYPCWSLAALINLLPSDITVVEEYLTTQYNIRIRKYKVVDDMDVYQIAYGNYGSSGSWHDMINTGEKESLLDAAFEMICWLKKEKYI